MTVDPKVVGGGVAVVAIGGGTGYAISNATSSKTESSTTENTAPSKPKIKEKLTEANFESILSLEQSQQSAEWTKVIEALKTANPSETKTEEDLKRECTALLDENHEESKFKTAAKKCVKLTTFEERARDKLRVDLITAEDKWEERITKLTGEEEFKKLIKNTSTTATVPSANTQKTDLKGYCEKAKDITFGTVKANKDPIEKEWTTYLKICATNLTKSNIDYWTGKAPSTTSPTNE